MEGIGPKRVDETLETVGLGARGGDLVKRYSLGMKQRLAIGAALLKDPEVLILDEPANGLDPAGIREIRELIRRLGGEGRTVFVSSHILSEIQQMADHVAILSRGRCVAAGSVKEVIQRSRPGGLIVRVGDLERGREVLQSAGVANTIEGDRLLAATDDAELVSRSLAQQGLYVTELRPDEIDLESVFLEITGEGEQIG
jgi:ABC-2 type transport system ATP-binding protein